MVSLRSLIGLLAVSACVFARPVKPPDTQVVTRDGNRISAATHPRHDLGTSQLFAKRSDDEEQYKHLDSLGRDPSISGQSRDSQASSSDRSTPGHRVTEADLSAEEQTLRSLHLMRSDPLWEPILRFHLYYRRILPSGRLGDFGTVFRLFYGPYQLRYPDRREKVDFQDPEYARALTNDDTSRPRLRDMNRIIEKIIEHADQLRLDSIRREYLKALNIRFNEVDRILTPSLSEINGMWNLEFLDVYLHSGRLVDDIPAETKFGPRIARLKRHSGRILQDFNFISMLETEFDHLMRRVEPRAPAKLVRRDEESLDQPAVSQSGSEAVSNQAGGALFTSKNGLKQAHRLQRRAGHGDEPASASRLGPEPSSPAPLSSAEILSSFEGPPSSRESTMELYRIKPEDSEAEPLVAFLSRNELIFAREKTPKEAASAFALHYRGYQDIFPNRGYLYASSEGAHGRDLVHTEAGLSRITHMRMLINRIIEHAEDLHLDSIRVRFLRALASRLQSLKSILSPTSEALKAQIRERAEEQTAVLPPGASNQRNLASWGTKLLDRRRQKLQKHMHRISTDCNLIFRLETELDELARRASTSNAHLVRRSTQKPQSEQADLDPSATIGMPLNRLVELHRRAGNDDAPGGAPFQSASSSAASSSSGSRDGAVHRPNAEILARLGMSGNEPDADQIIAFHSRHELVLRPGITAPRFVSRYGPAYRLYQERFGPTGTSLSEVDDFLSFLSDHRARDRIRNMKGFVRLMINHAQELQLDQVRIEYLRALQARFQSVDEILTPTLTEIFAEYARRRVEQSRRLPRGAANQINIALQRDDRVTDRISKITENVERLPSDFHFLFRLEVELDDLFGRAGSSVRPLVRRSKLRKEAGDAQPSSPQSLNAEAKSSSERSASHPLKLLRRRIGTPPPSQERLGSIEDTLDTMQMAPDSPGALAIADFFRRREPLVPIRRIAAEDRQRLVELYRPYYLRHPVSGDALDLQNRVVLFGEMAYSSGRDRFRDIQPIIEHLLRHRDALELNGFRERFLEAVRERFQRSEAEMTPTVDELIGLGTRRERAARIVRWINNDYNEEPSQVRDRLRQRVHPVIRTPETYIQDLHFLQRIESDLDEILEHYDQELELASRRTAHPPVKKRDLPQVSSSENAPAEEATVPPEAQSAKSRLVEILPRATDPASRGQSIWREPTLHDALQHLGLRSNDVGALPIADFWRMNQLLFRPVPRDRETLQQLAAVYRSYQGHFPIRGPDFDTRSEEVLSNEMMETSGRNRFRAIDAVLSHLLQHHSPLQLDDTRVSYLEALRERFLLSAQLLTPTPSEIVDRSVDARTVLPAGRSSLDNLHSTVSRTLEFLRVRTRIAQNNIDRISLDFHLLSHLEAELDHLVRGADTRMTTGARMLRRDTSGAARLRPRLQPRRNNAAAPEEVRGSRPNPAPLLPTNAILTTIHMPQDDPGAEAIADFLRRSQPLLPLIRRAPEHRARLVSLYRDYQRATPVRGEHLILSEEATLSSLLTEDAGRDRFRRMERILRYLLAHREPLSLDRGRVAFLEALDGRFKETTILMSPTLDDLHRQGLQAMMAKRRGKLSGDDLEAVMQELAVSREERLRRGAEKAVRFTHDLSLVRLLEQELDTISDQFQRVAAPLAAGSSRRLVRRRSGQESHERGGEQVLEKRRLSSESVVSQEPTRDDDMRQILEPVGMHLGDAHARPIAAWRLSESSLLQQRTLPLDLWTTLRAKWLAHRQLYEMVPVTSAEILPLNVRLHQYFVTDEGERFARANDMIGFILEHRARLRLTAEEVDYLDALHNRFEGTYRLMQPLPSTLLRAVRAEHPNHMPQELQMALVARLNARNVLIQAHARQVVIDTALLRIFESELEFLHELTPHVR